MIKLTASLSLLLALAAPMAAGAAVPPEVMTSYKAYNTAMQAKDYDTALKHGKAAWKAAEKKMGDSKTTGDLAFNYGFLAKSRGKADAAIKALERGVELAEQGRDKGAAVRLERSVELVSAYELAGKNKDVTESADNALKLAEKAGLSSSVYAGEILVHRATACSKVANRAARRLERSANSQEASRFKVKSNRDINANKIQQKCASDSKKASMIFSQNKKLARPKYIALAANLNGYGSERNNDWIAAALSYQDARTAIEDSYGRDNPMVMQIIGRWIYSYGQIQFNGDLGKAKAAGLCDCWPYEKNTEKVKVVKRSSAGFPTNALEIKSSGYVILKADVTDDGKTENIRVVQSWPEGQYDKYALRSFEEYQYAVKSGAESDGARKDVIEAFNFTIYNQSTKKSY